MKAESERARTAQQSDPVISPRRNGSRHHATVDLSRLGPKFEEQYQKLWRNLFANGSRESLRRVMVVGSRHGEGTTTTCTILAARLARANAGAGVLVDANLRTPSLHELFALPTASRGLTDITNETLGAKIWPSTPIPNLFVIQSRRPLQSLAVLYQEPIAGLIAALWRSQIIPRPTAASSHELKPKSRTKGPVRSRARRRRPVPLAFPGPDIPSPAPPRRLRRRALSATGCGRC